MSTDNFGSLGADFFIKTYDKGSTMSQADLDALVQYVQLTTTILAIGDFTPDQQDSVWMILERTDVNTAPGYTVTNNTDVTMTSGGLVTINSLPWSKITGKPSFFSGNYNDLTNKPTIPGEVDIGNFIFSLGDASLPASNTMTLSTFRSGANEESKLTLNPTGESSLYASGVLKLGTGYGSGSEQYWQFGANGVLTIPGSGDIVQNGVSVLGGGGTTLPADASGYLNNNGSGTLTWVAGNPAGSGMLPYTDVVVFSNTVAGDWTSFTLSGTMDSFNDYNSSYATITLSSQTALGVQAVSNTKTLWINDSKVDSNDYMVIEFPPSPTVGDVFNITTSSAQTTVNAGSFVVGQTYTILTTGDTNWTAIGSSYGGVGATFIATGAGSGTGTATTPAGAKKIIYKPAAGQRARTFPQGQTASLWFGTGGTYDFMYADAAAGNSGMLLTFVFAGAIDGTPSWYQVYF